jgi:hypothetical protein
MNNMNMTKNIEINGAIFQSSPYHYWVILDKPEKILTKYQMIQYGLFIMIRNILNFQEKEVRIT